MVTEWPEGYDLITLESVDSTMAEAQRRLSAIAGPTWILAHEQTAGKGRRGRKWDAPRGNLTASLVLPHPGMPLQSAQRSFVAALALYEGLSLYLADAHIALKWPNDVLVKDRKIAGILLEAHQAGQAYLVIGIGVNLNAAPPAEALEKGAVLPASLAEFCNPPTPEHFLTVLAATYARQESMFAEEGFAASRTAWLAQASRIGEVITARTTQDSHTGRFVDVDNQGHLVLETDTGRIALPAADIYF